MGLAGSQEEKEQLEEKNKKQQVFGINIIKPPEEEGSQPKVVSSVSKLSQIL